MSSPKLKPQAPEEMLTIEEVAGLLKVSPATVRRLIERKELTKTSVLRSVRIKVSDYNRYVGGL